MSSKQIEGAYPLSPIQQGMLFHSLYEPEAGLYVSRLACVLERLSADAFERAWQRVVDRHPILRTAFAWEKLEQPLQVVGRQVNVRVERHDWRAMSEPERERQLAAFLEAERVRGFKLSKAPLMRLNLFQIGDDSYRFVWTHHHILLDGWSLPLVFNEVLTFYDAFVRGQEPALPQPRPFREYIAWLQRQDLAQAETFWRHRLSGFTAPTPLPFARPGGDAIGAQAEQAVSVSAAITEALQALARRQHMTLNTLLQGVWALLLSRYSGEDEVVFGTTVSGRPAALPGVEEMIGLFINTLPVRVRVASGERFLPWLQALQAQQAEMRRYEYSPLFEIRNWSDVPHGLPLFESIVVFENYPLDAATDRPDSSVTVRDVRATQWTNLPLALIAEPGPRLVLRCAYDCGRFEATAIERLLGHLQTVLESITEQPDRRLDDLTILSAAERRQLLVSWNATDADYPRDACMHDLFEAQVARMPDAIAAIYDDQQLSYAALDSRSNQLARHLRALGVKTGTRVGLCVQRSLDLIVGLLGIFKAGAAYVPLDPTYPAARLRFMAADADIAVLLTQRRLLPHLPQLADDRRGVGIVCLDADWERIAQAPATRPTIGVSADDLAYLIYTSGSTGQPKGAMIPQRAIVNHTLDLAARWQLALGERVLQFISVSFDASLEELLPPLVSGATLVIPDAAPELLGSRLAQDCARHAITMLHLPTAFWQPWAEQLTADDAARLSTVRLLHLGGDRVARSALQSWVRLLGRDMAFVNAYGPTETTIEATAYPTSCVAASAAAGTVPIGRPTANQQVYLLDRWRQPVPLGVPGEIYLGGDGLGWGYHARPDLTAEKFVPHPFGETPGARLYRTGDLARYRADGTLEFLGRVDQQVKLRGFRIELGEIEAALRQHPAVHDAIVLAREDAPGEKRLVAYVVEQRTGAMPKGHPARGEGLPPAFRAHLKDQLPDYMIPSAFVVLDALPLLPNGKIDRRALPAPEELRPSGAAPHAAPRTELEQTIAAVWQAVLHVEQIGAHDNFFDLGGHSLRMLQVQGKLRAALNREISMVDLFRYPTVSALAAALSAPPPDPKRAVERGAQHGPASGPDTSAIAIIGMSGRFPGAESIDAFWRNLRDGTESISFFSDDELLAAGVDPSLIEQPNYVKAGGALDQIEYFAAAFFGYTPREAEMMEPQHRLFLECAWESLEHAGYSSHSYAGRIGVFAGAGLNSYLLNLYSNRALLGEVGVFQTGLGNEKDHVATRVSYKLNLKGPSLNVQTSCSTSLVAVHLACRSLLIGECAIALAGGVAVNPSHRRGYLYEAGGVNSPDGHCRAFDAAAQGTVSGSGVGVVVLKRLADALADGDTVHAVIRGSAINNDGAAKVGYTAPSVDGQAQVIADALAAAGVAPGTISYIEAHGTGTPLGDPIEIAALNQVFGGTQPRGSIAIGSVKTNIGHLDAAAGVAGLIKAALMLKHRQIPPSLHFQQPNPQIDFAAGPLYVNTALAEWQPGGTPRRAGVSSFGIGGTNAHVIVEEAPPIAADSTSRPWHLLALSAKTETALEQATDNLAQYLRQHPNIPLADVAYTLQLGRQAFSYRRALVCRDHADALAALTTDRPQRVMTGAAAPYERPVVFLFPGQGAQYAEMARELYQDEPVFRSWLDRCAELFRPHLHPEGTCDLRDAIYPSTTTADPGAIDQTELTQPALFAVEYALAQLWIAWGVRPHALIGHSIGEYVAACLAGVLTLESAAALVAARGRLMQALPSGTMLSVPLPERDLAPLLGSDLALAAVNGPALCVLSGSFEAVAAVEQRLDERGVATRRLHTSHAFHSPLIDPMLDAFRSQVRQVALQPPTIPFISNVSGTWITAAEATDPEYWVAQLRQTVRFADGIAELMRHHDWALLEVGPGRTLSTLARQQCAPADQRIILTSLRHPQDQQADRATMLAALGRLWLAGVAVDWAALYAERRRRVPLPTYPFERQRYWIEPRDDTRAGIQPRSASGKTSKIANWLYSPWWQRTQAPELSNVGENRQPSQWLIFADSAGFGDRIAGRLAQTGQQVIVVRGGAGFAPGDDGYTIDPRRPEDYTALLHTLRSVDRAPQAIMHCWSVSGEADAQPTDDQAAFASAQDRGYYSLLFLTQALEAAGLAQPLQDGAPIRLAVLTSGLHDVTGDEAICTPKTPLLGACKVIPQEYPSIACQCIDVVLPQRGGRQMAALIDHLIAECAVPAPDLVVAYRGRQRWVQTYEPIRLDQTNGAVRPLRERGVYLITGGLGRVGLLLAEHLTQTVHARLALVGRTALPPRAEWERWLSEHEPSDPVSRKLRDVLALEQQGAEVLVVGADVAEHAQMRDAIARVYERFGALHGVIHAAGVTTGPSILSPISAVGRAESEMQFRPKAHGLYVLDRLLRDQELDFCLLVSSNAAVLGGLGFAAYAAANVFMDAFATNRNKTSATAWISANWDGWPQRETEAESTVAHSSIDQYSMTPAEARAAFDHVVTTAPDGQVVVSTGDLAARLNVWIKHDVGARSADSTDQQDATVLHPRPQIRESYVAPGTEIEQQLAAIWQQVLGLEQVGIHDSFFDLGGHSLLATQVMSRIRQTFNIELPLQSLFTAPTVAQAARLIVEKQVEQTDRARLEQLLAEIRQLSPDDVQAMLEAEQPFIDKGEAHE
ncbi:MAG TPA: amino acid adenylation domain-containing protein [Herpetosiphonaceae bacterium]